MTGSQHPIRYSNIQIPVISFASMCLHPHHGVPEVGALFGTESNAHPDSSATRTRHAVRHGASHRTPAMSSSPYTVLTTLYGHTNSINVVRSSPDGKYLASGSDDGTIIIYSTKNWKAVKRYGNLSPVTALAWHPTVPSTIIFGCQNGDVQTVHFKDPEVRTIFLEDQSADRSS